MDQNPPAVLPGTQGSAVTSALTRTIGAAGLHGAFGVIKLWPGLKVAEDEVIARLRNTARLLGLRMVTVDHRARMIDPPYLQMTSDDLDFVIHLHFGTPKSYDIFSFVVLWNPLQFYYDFNYRRVTRHLLTHDDFLSCGSRPADDQVARMTLADSTRDGPCFTMYHSVCEPILAPTLGDRKLFYSGINWERLGKPVGRHKPVLDELDLSGKLRIYGPRVLQDVKVWEGYQSYQGSLPFDGVSIMREINRCGIALVLSSDAHVDAALMSNRLFEALAGGAVVICDQNPFARTHFGDTLLYIDTRYPADEVAAQILDHIRWVEQHPTDALALAQRAQDLFCRTYRLDLALSQIYDGFAARRNELARLGGADRLPPTTMYLLMPRYDVAAMEQHIANLRAQRGVGCRIVLVADTFELRHFRPRIEAALQTAGVTAEVEGAEFFHRNGNGVEISVRRFGEMVAELLTRADADHLVCMVAPNEAVFANHLPLLANALADRPDAAFAYSAMILSYGDGAPDTACEVHEVLDPLAFTANFPFGFARILFRPATLGHLTQVLLPYLDVAAIAGLCFHTRGAPSHRATMVLDIDRPFNVGEAIRGAGARGRGTFPTTASRSFDERLVADRDVIRDVDPPAYDQAWSVLSGSHKMPDHPRHQVPAHSDHLMPRTLYIDRLTRRNRQIVLAQLLQALPVPNFVWKLLRPLRPWRDASRDADHAP